MSETNFNDVPLARECADMAEMLRRYGHFPEATDTTQANKMRNLLERAAIALTKLTERPNLRDRFAGMAMHTELMTCGVPGEASDSMKEACEATGVDPLDHMASNAYEIADAMIRARQS